jgi:hypothetical protein
MAEEHIQFWRYLTIEEVEAYCYAQTADQKQNIICDALRVSLVIYPFGEGIYFYELGPRVFEKFLFGNNADEG